MERQKNNANIQKDVCRLLAITVVLSGKLACCEAIVTSNCIQAVAAVMHQNLHCTELQEAACYLLAFLAEKGDRYATNIAANCLPAVVSAMEQNSSHADLQEIFCGLLAKLAFHAEGVSEAIAAARGIPTILAAMQRHSSNITLQQDGCWLLGKFSEDEDCRKTIDALCACEILVTVLQHHLEHAQLQGLSCRALSKQVECEYLDVDCCEVASHSLRRQHHGAP